MDKEAKRTGNVYHYERTENARQTWVQRDDVVGPEQFDQILQAIEPHICTKYTKMGGSGLIGCLIGIFNNFFILDRGFAL